MRRRIAGATRLSRPSHTRDQVSHKPTLSKLHAALLATGWLGLGLGSAIPRVLLRGRLLAAQGDLFSPRCGVLALLELADTLHAFDRPRLSSAFAHVGKPLAPIGALLARVGVTVSGVRDSVARLRCGLSQAHAVLSRVHLRFPHLHLDLARLSLGTQLLPSRRSRHARFLFRSRATRVFGGDQARPAAFQSRAGTLVRGRVAMQVRAGPLPSCSQNATARSCAPAALS